MDSDIIKFKNNRKFLKTLIKANKDIIVPRIDIFGMKDYDKNSWRGERTKPNQNQLKMMDNNDWENVDYIPKDKEGKIYHYENYLKNENNEYEINKNNLNYVVPLDSVGGAVLLVKSIIFKQGIMFPTSYIVGTTWDRIEGYDGIETEGICYMAKSLGYSCWGMPNLYALHAGT
ncbi:unnamed protein product [Candida verbasci]|uniref:Uncharacterized protein n=1 Tax=Candida verbasci TaxID=1227364 RepID=A0A9W4XFK7_9ASCO|nr:unnamed protein product [Candida verbasci]